MKNSLSRIDEAVSMISFSRRGGYDWDKLIEKQTLKRNEWLSKIWTSLYFQNQEDEFIRNLSTDELLKTRWFEKYGIKEPNF